LLHFSIGYAIEKCRCFLAPVTGCRKTEFFNSLLTYSFGIESTAFSALATEL
jgi:hypothetical protein